MKDIKYAALFGGSGKNRESKEYRETIKKVKNIEKP